MSEEVIKRKSRKGDKDERRMKKKSKSSKKAGKISSQVKEADKSCDEVEASGSFKAEKSIENDSDAENDGTQSEGDEKEEDKAEKTLEPETNEDEITIDLSSGAALSKKQKRLLKKGKLNVEKLNKKHQAKPIPLEGEEGEEVSAKSKKSEFGVWIGNLSYDTTQEDLITFLTAKTSVFGDKEDDGFVVIEKDDIVRVNIPKKQNRSKGFAYVDFKTKEQVQTAISLSESQFNGRNLLIKDAHSFEGRPEKDLASSLSKNPPSRILFVGNLSFDTTQDLLEEHFRHCGHITRIRMATFEDTGKCKGFAFIDFRDESGPTTALKSKLAKKLINRPLRLEYGEDRSKRTPKSRGAQKQTEERDIETPAVSSTAIERVNHQDRQPKRKRVVKERETPNKRVNSSVALATAQRASAAIVPSSGKKVTFD